MDQLDVILRACGGTLAVALAGLLLVHRPAPRLALYFLGLAAGLAGFLAVNTPEAGLRLTGEAGVAVALLSGNAAVFLWWFCLAAFDDEFRLGRIELGVGAAWLIAFLLDRGFLFPGVLGEAPNWALVAMALCMVCHIAWRLLRDRDDDLVEPRRQARFVVVALLAALLLGDLAVDVLLGFGWRPQAFTVLQNALIVLLITRMASWLLKPNPDLATRRRTPPDPSATTSGPPVAEPAVDERLRSRLDQLIEVDRIHLDPNLTFAGFAERMGAPAPAVRRFINRDLGYRHFRSFLNDRRVAEARRALADPATANEKIISIAFDAGFASLASFNRAFSQVEGVAPSQYRARVLERAGQGADPAG